MTFYRSECILPARTAVYAYIDQETGDLWILGDDLQRQDTAELRINAEDVAEFVEQIAGLVEDGHRRLRSRP
jgi:hypothetical protein